MPFGFPGQMLLMRGRMDGTCDHAVDAWLRNESTISEISIDISFSYHYKAQLAKKVWFTYSKNHCTRCCNSSRMGNMSNMWDKLDKWDMTDRQDRDTMGKLDTMEWMGSADSWVSMALMDLVAYIPVECHRHRQSLQLHHLGVHRLYKIKHETTITSLLIYKPFTVL